jgi:hypothetical protein
MAIFNTPLGMNVKDNPLKFSPFVLNSTIEQATPPIGEDDLLTESGVFILTENGIFLATE